MVPGEHVASSSVQVSKAVEKEKQWLKAQQIDTYGTCFARGTALDLKWSPPHKGVVKCNVNADWISSDIRSGTAWIARDCTGSVLYHARDALTKSPNRIIAELRCILWTLQSLRDLRFQNVIISSDCQAAIAALYNPWSWPRYGALLMAIIRTARSFFRVSFELVSCHSNTIARDIAESVVRDERYHSYVALDGPAWLRNRLLSEAQRV